MRWWWRAFPPESRCLPGTICPSALAMITAYIASMCWEVCWLHWPHTLLYHETITPTIFPSKISKLIKINVALSRSGTKISPLNFAQATTAQLLWHMQNFVVIWWLNSELQRNVIWFLSEMSLVKWALGMPTAQPQSVHCSWKTAVWMPRKKVFNHHRSKENMFSHHTFTTCYQ